MSNTGWKRTRSRLRTDAMKWWRIQNECRLRCCDPHVDTLTEPASNWLVAMTTRHGEDWLDERSRVSEGSIGPSRVTLKQTLRGLFLRPVRSDPAAQVWQHHEQHRDRAPRGPTTTTRTLLLFHLQTHTTKTQGEKPMETVLRTVNQGKPYCDNNACTTTSNKLKGNSWN